MNRIQYIAFSLLLPALTFTNNLHAQVVSGSINGHDYVDLGLPSGVLWVTCNVGASSPEEFGDYYAWGETSTKTEYTQNNSKTNDNNSYNYNIGGNSATATDAARANWGASWRLPTKTECQELIDNCAWTWITQGDRDGIKLTGPNGNSIFLPAAGFGGESFKGNTLFGHYWTSIPEYEFSAKFAYSLSFFSQSLNVDLFSDRSLGHSIRPVSDCTTILQTTRHVGNRNKGTSNGHDYVDLGLSVKWATTNIGAEKSSDIGYYYGWGNVRGDLLCASYQQPWGDIGGDKERDAATANWGSPWRMPNVHEMAELIDNCEWSWTTLCGQPGYLVKSKRNGEEIFLPATGWKDTDETIKGKEDGAYWTSEPADDEGENLRALSFCFIETDEGPLSSWSFLG